MSKPTKKSKVRKINPTLRQTIAFKKLSEILGNKGKSKKHITIGKLLQEAGYSKEMSESPKQVTESKGFQSLLEKFLPDEKLLGKHSHLLNAVGISHYTFSNAMTDKMIKAVIEEIPGCKFIKTQRSSVYATAYFSVPDNRTQSTAIDMGYKLKGHYKSDKNDQEANKNLEEFLDRAAKLLPD